MEQPKRKDKRDAHRLKQSQQAKRRLLIRRLKPLVFAFLLWFVLNALINLPWFKEPVYSFFLHFTTHAAYWFSKLIMIPLEMHGVPYLSAKGFHMQVVMECTAYNFYLFAVALTIFSRWAMKDKLINLAVFFLGIFVLNNLRFVSMGYLGSYRPELFDPVHDIVWDVLFGFAVFGLWVWREMAAEKKESAGMV